MQVKLFFATGFSRWCYKKTDEPAPAGLSFGKSSELAEATSEVRLKPAVLDEAPSIHQLKLVAKSELRITTGVAR